MARTGPAGLVEGLPDHLPALDGRTVRIVRTAWIGAMALVVAIQLAGIAFILFDSYRGKPALRAIGLETRFGDDDEAILAPLRADAVTAGIRTGARLLRINGQNLSPDASSFAIARAVLDAPGHVVRVRVRNPDGAVIDAALDRRSKARSTEDPDPIPRDLRMTVRLAFTLLCSLSLLASTTILFLRRSHDPEAMLFAFAFLGVAASVDPPLLLWLASGWGAVLDWLCGTWWILLVIAFAAFPDGRFTPRWLRWSLLVAPVLGVVLAIDEVGELVSILIAVVCPLLVLAMLIVRYRRLRSGLERQQIKWAAFGFAVGFALAGVAFTMAPLPWETWGAAARSLWRLAIVCIFSLAFAVMPLGLLVSLLKFRLWDVDAIISRSAAFTVLTGFIALTWAAAADIAKAAVSWVMGAEHNVLGLAIGAIIAAGIFAPTQGLVVAWSKRRFDSNRLDLESLPARLESWRDECDAPTLAMRALDAVVAGVHADTGAILLRTPIGRSLLAAANIESPLPLADRSPAQHLSGGTFAHLVDLADAEGLVGWLLLGPRTDHAPYSRADLASLTALAGPIADALRGALAGQAVPAAAGLLAEMQARLATLERGQRPLSA